MEQGHQHFSHPHTLSFHKSLDQDAQLITCNGCTFPCTGTPVYSCDPCKFFLHDQCFNATRSLNHSSHPQHPLSLFPSPTYTSGSFVCNSCNKTGSGLCFCCPACGFDLHIHCAYSDLNPKPAWIGWIGGISLKSHPSHPLIKYHQVSRTHSCDVCGTACVPGTEVYRCDICDYDAHVGCTSLPETVRREDHEHTLSLLYENPQYHEHPLFSLLYSSFECDVCRGVIKQKNCMYKCTSGCNYVTHVKCVTAKVRPLDEKTFRSEMLKLHNKMEELQTAVDTLVSGSQGVQCNR
ncbi:hypothetical protein SSX86_015753 [Deinandra increscens subsp. villosa]|uniref:DC1 domain-containing protein n=1 Tax=Deinandra increscens subsp. villosa TaxID=3103831 RepID=A0AAP0CYC1_9ASTR